MHDYFSEISLAWPIFLGSAVMLLLLFAGREVGAGLRRRVHARGGPQPSENEHGYAVSGVLGLLALLVAFTFGIALNRYEYRRTLVVTEANAIGTFGLRTALLREPGPVRVLLRDYVALRLEDGRLDRASPAQQARQDAARQRLWQATIAAIGADRGTSIAVSMLPSLNEAFDTAAARSAERAARLPGRVMATLLVYAIISSLVVGYAIFERRLRLLSYLMLALLVLSIGLILDLDLPRTGSILIPQAAMEEAFRGLNGS